MAWSDVEQRTQRALQDLLVASREAKQQQSSLEQDVVRWRREATTWKARSGFSVSANQLVRGVFFCVEVVPM